MIAFNKSPSCKIEASQLEKISKRDDDMKISIKNGIETKMKYYDAQESGNFTRKDLCYFVHENDCANH